MRLEPWISPMGAYPLAPHLQVLVRLRQQVSVDGITRVTAALFDSPLTLLSQTCSLARGTPRTVGVGAVRRSNSVLVGESPLHLLNLGMVRGSLSRDSPSLRTERSMRASSTVMVRTRFVNAHQSERAAPFSSHRRVSAVRARLVRVTSPD